MPTAHQAPALDTVPPRTSAIVRLVNVVVDPAAAFRDIRAAHPWALALAAVISLRFVSLLVFYDPALTPLKVVASLGFQVAAVVPPLLVGSTLVWLAGKPWRLGATWVRVFSICTHVTVAHTLATIAFASVAGAMLPDAASIDVRNPPFTNLGALVERSGSTALLHRLAAEVDVRSAYAAVLLWLGLRAAGEPGPQRDVGAAAASTVAAVAVTRVAVITALALVRG